MAFKIIWHEESQDDIHEILDYLLNEWSYHIAENFSEYLIKTTSQLETLPYIGRPHKTLSVIRELSLKPHYIVCYTVSKKSQEVHILNILDSRKNY